MVSATVQHANIYITGVTYRWGTLQHAERNTLENADHQRCIDHVNAAKRLKQFLAVAFPLADTCGVRAYMPV